MLICKNADNTIRWKQGERLNHLFERRCDRVPADHLAVITEDVSLTFRELDNRANQAARYLLDQGLKAGDRIGAAVRQIHPFLCGAAGGAENRRRLRAVRRRLSDRPHRLHP